MSAGPPPQPVWPDAPEESGRTGLPDLRHGAARGSATEAPIEVLYADAALVVLNKPAGLLAVPGRGADKQDCLSGRVQQVFPDALVVHRLDMATSGLMIMARGVPVQRQLNHAFANRAVDKRYTAVVAGQPAALDQGDWNVIDLPIAVDWPRRPLRVIDPVQGKPSMTRWRVSRALSLPNPQTPIDEGGESDGCGSTRVTLEPVTGRSHQLRVHLQAIGHPILGDALYAPAEVQASADRLLLHACHLALDHPVTGRRLEFECATPF